MFGDHLTGWSTATLFLFGIVVGAVALLALSVLLAGARRTGSRGPDARRAMARFQRERAFIDRARDTRHEHQQRADTATTAPVPRQLTARLPSFNTSTPASPTRPALSPPPIRAGDFGAERTKPRPHRRKAPTLMDPKGYGLQGQGLSRKSASQ